ncbi:MAG: phosphatidylserine decarboxylase family protein [Bacteroidetes bacterium]|nr:phosphatidylserine decarboxylase family protein [Bacteroidota bacterium]
MITKYGYSTAGIIFLAVIILFIISYFTANDLIRIILICLGLFVSVFTLNFFRDPERTAPIAENIVVSPADGKVLLIKDIKEERFLGGEAKQVSVFMSPLNVHVNRIPINGTVDYLEYHNGEYLVAFHDKADERNERSEIGILSKYGKVLFTQVAGFIARRIVYELSKGDTVKMGERFGMIKFGSRVDVIVDHNWDLKVKEGDIVKAGESILFEYNK